MNNITIRESYDTFLEHGKSFWAPGTLKYYEKNVRYFLEYLEKRLDAPLDTVYLPELPETVFAEYVVYLRAKDRFAGHPLRDRMNVNGSIKSNTVRTYCRATKAYFNFLYKGRYTNIRYTEDVKLPKSDDDMIVPLLASEVYKIDSVFDLEIPNDLRNYCIVHLMLDAGLRSCEVVSLEPGNIIFDSNTIIINRSKGNKSRAVVMVPALSQALHEYIDLFSPSGTLFRKVNSNKGINKNVIDALFLRIRNTTGIDRLHPHLLRHTFATSFIMGGGNLETLRILLGHYDYSVTRNYLHLASQYLILDADIYRLDPVFFKRAY